MKTLLILVTVLAATAASPRPSHATDDEGSHGDICSRDSEWGYGETNGPDTWPDTYPTCGGSKQSPVALVTDEALGTNWEPLELINYDIVPPTMTITNTGHTVEVIPATDAAVSGGDLPDTYIFAQFHFHWGSVDAHGSEHTLDGERFPAELHLVHYMEGYGSVEEAEKHDDGLVVLSVLLELSSDDNPALEPILDSLTEIISPGEEASITPISLRSILPSNTEEYFSYEGSLTTPTCDEVVLWTVFKEHIPISNAQLDELRELEFEDGSPMEDNFRDLQPLNDRQVYLSL